MTKAQEVRQRRLEMINSDLTTQAQEVFEWILDLMDKNIQAGYYGSLKVFLYQDGSTFMTTGCNSRDLDSLFFLNHDRLTFFLELKQVIEQEDGYKAIIDPDFTIYDEKAISLDVFIE